MDPDVLVPVALQTPSSVGQGQLEGTRAELTKVESRAVALVTKQKNAPRHKTHTRDTGWSRTRHLSQTLSVKGQKDGAGRGAVPSSSR